MTGSSNANEATVARTMLSDLLTEWGLTQSDIPAIIAANTETTAAASLSTVGPDVNVFDLVSHLIEKHIATTPAERVAVTLWILHTYVFNRFRVTPRLAIISPVRGCGKSRLLDLIQYLIGESYRVDDVSPAAIYRWLDDSPDTVILIDEGDNLDLLHNHKLRSLLNSGHSKSGGIGRVAGGRSQNYRTFAPLCVAAIGLLPLPLMHRCILINMQRASDEVRLEQFDEQDSDFAVARIEISTWAATCELDPNPEMPPSLIHRAADNWRALFSIADHLDRGEVARNAALRLCANRPDEDPGVVALGHIRSVLDKLGVDRIVSQDLVDELVAFDDIWSDWRDDQPLRKLTQPDLARLLRPFHIRPRSIRLIHRGAGSLTRKGYMRSQFEDAWRSYCSGGTPAQANKIRKLASV
jgi:hypothetical protein